MNYITFDIETYNPDENMKTAGRGKIDISKLKISTIGAYYSWLDEYVIFWEEDVVDFIETLKYADFIVGYNHVSFDLPVLQKYTNFDLKTLQNYDIMLEVEKQIGFKLRLNDLASSNLKFVKTDSFANFRTYHLEDKWHELSYYCIHDVKITQNLFEKILKGQELKYSDMLSTKTVKPVAPSKNGFNISSTALTVEELF
jgi:DNA polymerase elongation subunit (family B)